MHLSKILIILALLMSAVCIVMAQDQVFDTTLTLNNNRFEINMHDVKTDIKVLLTISSNSKILLKDTIDGPILYNSHYFMEDFNKDGYPDILLDHMGNNDFQTLYLFDTIKNNFILIKGFENFPSSAKIKNTKSFYYSYHRAGCADADWISDLFIIKNCKAIELGHIEGDGCDGEGDKPIIKIYRVPNENEDKKELVETLPYKTTIPEFGYKWTFIKNYWNKNHQKFIK